MQKAVSIMYTVFSFKKEHGRCFHPKSLLRRSKSRSIAPRLLYISITLFSSLSQFSASLSQHASIRICLVCGCTLTHCVWPVCRICGSCRQLSLWYSPNRSSNRHGRCLCASRMNEAVWKPLTACQPDGTWLVCCRHGFRCTQWYRLLRRHQGSSRKLACTNTSHPRKKRRIFVVV